MWTTKARKKRLDLLHLEEYEVLTEELPCVCKVYLPQNSTYRKEQGLIHVCSKSLIFESDSENIPMFKYLYRFCTEIPAVGKSSKLAKRSKIAENNQKITLFG